MIDVLDHDTRSLPKVASKQQTAPPHHPSNHASVVVLLPLRLFLAAGWLRAGAEKLIDPQWWNGNDLRKFLTAQHNEALPFFRPIMDRLIAPGAQTVAIVVVITQLACGLAIAIGKPLRLALRWVFLLNVVFIMAGRVNPSAFYLVMEIVLLFAIADGTIGVRPTTPSWRTMAAAGTSAVLAIAVAPYIRRIEPSKVIEDPAMMLVFLGFVITATLIVRSATYRPPQATYFRRLWTTWIAVWMHAKPSTIVRPEYERRYFPRGNHFAPPRRGTAAKLPPLPQSLPAIHD